jgi:Glycosyltransferase family 87
MAWDTFRRTTGRKEELAGVFLLACALMNGAGVVRLLPLLRNGYQDFTIFYSAGTLVRRGGASQLYDLGAQYQVQTQFAPNVAIRQAALPYNHPPVEALLFVPLSYLNYWPAYLVWTFLNVILVALSLWVMRRALPEIGRLNVVLVILACAGFAPLAMALVQGQDSVLLLALVTLSVGALVAERDVWAGAALGVGLFKFQFVIPFMLIVALRRPRVLLGFGAAAAAVVAMSAMMVGWSGLADYVHFVVGVESHGAGGAIIASMPNIRGLLAGLMGAHGAGRLALWLNIAASVAVLGIAMWWVGRGEVRLRMLVVMATVVSVLVSYHALVHDVTFLLPVMLLMLGAVETGASDGMRDLILLMMAYTILLASSVWPWITAWWFVPVAIWSYGRYAGVHREEVVA